MEGLIDEARAAISANDEAALRDAIRRGADVNGMIACANKHTGERGLCPLLYLATSMGLAGMCEILLVEGADANIPPTTMAGFVPLHSAASRGSTACVRLLLRAGADANARENEAGFTSLRFALLNGHREVALTLLRAGAAITVLRTEWIKPENKSLQNYMVDIIDTGGWNARVERHRRPLMSILSNLALPHDALCVILSFWSPPGGR
jgi:ankyrin repeat protein